MADDLVQDFAFRQFSKAIMSTANQLGSAGNNGGAPAEEGGFFDVMRRKWSQVQDVLQGITAPLKRRSMYDELPEHVWPSEHIEMHHLQQQGQGRGHQFIPCHLTNPTWCDYCGDFIWGVFKQCLRCQSKYTLYL